MCIKKFTFFDRCGETGNSVDGNLTCGDINDVSWSGVIMTSTCSLSNTQKTNDCQTVQRLNMSLQQELPVFDWNNNVTYRSIACARCNNGGNLSFWGFNVTCLDSLQPPQNGIAAVKKFVEEKDKCSWKYSSFPSLERRYKSCVVHDLQCDSNQLPVMSTIKELCYSYSMAFSVKDKNSKYFYRNPHCALCNPEGRQEGTHSETNGPVFPPLSILFDVTSNVIPEKEEPQTAQPSTQGSKLTAQVLNCSSAMKNCTITYGDKTCLLLTSLINQSTQINLNTSSAVKVLTPQQIISDKEAMKPKEKIIYILCPKYETLQQHEFPTVQNYITFTGTLLSIISLCFLLAIYLSFKELRNLPGKCLISLSCALLCYQVIFLCAVKSNEVDAFCKVVAICLHFFVLAAFSWMSVMAFDAASTFKAQGKQNPPTS